ncbi:MAG: hypothetical protein J6O62_02685 [Bacilli bacterium]|nr:hypothetical protein [Bacilli bacterium]MBO6195570.1 hypothetical protein [Bacilli bacterium]
MKDKISAKECLRNFNCIYVLLAILTLLLIIPCYIYPQTSLEVVTKRGLEIGNLTASQILTISYIIESAFYIFNFLLVRRVVNGKSDGKVISILLLIGIVIGFLDQFNGIKISVASGMLVDLYILQLIYKVKKEQK